jgi:predicted XRE-type DNA-binding protein
MTKKIESKRSKGNVFADLGLSNPDARVAKAELARRISKAIEARGLTQVQAAKILDIDQPKVSALVRGRLKDFSTERLLRFLTALGHDVEIVIKRRTGRESHGGQLRVV